MNSSTNDIDRRSIPDWDVELDRYVVQLEKAYLNGSNESPVDILQYAPEIGHPRHAEIVRELIRVDMEMSFRKGEARGANYYRNLFGQLIADESICRDLDFEQKRLTLNVPSRDATNSLHDSEFPSIGQNLAGFLLQSELGRGSFGRVYIAIESGLANRRVVLKVSSQFPGEGELLSKLQHKNIVPIYSLHQHKQWHVVCMPLLGTTTLWDLLKAFSQKGHTPTTGVALVDTIKNCRTETWRREELLAGRENKEKEEPQQEGELRALETPVSDSIKDELLNCLRERFNSYSYGQAVIWILRQLAEGLSHAHERNILHRDLKPANILISDDAVPMLLDFNLAVENLRSGQSSQIFGGSPRYMSPEQLQEVITSKESSDVRSDIYSLGVILFELLTLRPPFLDRSDVGRESLQQMVNDRRTTPQLAVDKSAGLTSGMVAIVSKTLQFEPENRYQTSHEFLEDINRELHNQPLRYATGEALGDRLVKWNRRHPRLSASTLVAGAAAIVLVAASMAMILQNRRVGQLQAMNWLADAKVSRGIAQGVVSGIQLPEEQLKDMLKGCDSSLQQLTQVDLSKLTDEQTEEGEQLRGQLLMLRARGQAKLATLQPDSAVARELLVAAAQDAQQASSIPQQATAAEVLLSTIQRMQQSAGKSNLAAEVSTQLTLTPEQIREAMAAMRSSLATDATNPWYWTNLAQLQVELKDPQSAKASLQVALNLDSKLPWPSLMLGAMELEHNKFLEAKDLLSQTLRIDKQSADAHLNRALANIGLGDLPSALEDLNVIEPFAIQNPRILFVRELVYRRMGKRAEADKDRDRAMQIQPRDARSWNARGEAKLRISPADPEGALEDFRQASLTSPSLRNSYENMAHVLSEHLNRQDEAIAALDDAIACDSQYAMAWSSRSVLHARKGNAEAAVADAEQALRLDRAPIICYQAASAYALVRRNAKDEQLALSLLKETARQNPPLAELMKNDKDLAKIEDQKTLKQIIAAASQLK